MLASSKGKLSNRSNLSNRLRISEGQFYEAHQQLRVISARYVKASSPASAVEILSSGACLLLNAGQGGSGGDLGLLMLDIYIKSEFPPDAENKARALKVLRAFRSDLRIRKHAWRKRAVGRRRWFLL